MALDVCDDYATVGKDAWKKARVEHKIDFRVAPAIQSLNAMMAAGEEGTNDLVFIDADKVGYMAYYEACLRLLRTGGIIAIDNALFHGSVEKPISPCDINTMCIVEVNAKVKDDPRVRAVLLPIADGCYLARKL